MLIFTSGAWPRGAVWGLRKGTAWRALTGRCGRRCLQDRGAPGEARGSAGTGAVCPSATPTGCQARLDHRGWPCCSSPSPVSAAKSGSQSLPCPPTVAPKTRKGCPGPSSHPGVGLRQARSPGPAGRRRAGARPALCRQLPALLCLTSAKRMKCIWTAGLAPTQRPPAGRLVCRPSSLDRAPGRPAPPAWPAGQLASAALGAQERGVSGRLSVCVAGAASPRLGPAVKLSGSACPHPRLSGLGAVCESVSPCLIAVGMSGSAFPPLSLCLAVCLAVRVWVPDLALPLAHGVTWARPPHVSIASPCIRAPGSRRPAWPRPLLGHVALQTAAFPARGLSPPPPPATRPDLESRNESSVCQLFSHIPGRGEIGPNSSKPLAVFIKNFRNVHTTKFFTAYSCNHEEWGVARMPPAGPGRASCGTGRAGSVRGSGGSPEGSHASKRTWWIWG